jgi:hypothetical protein
MKKEIIVNKQFGNPDINELVEFFKTTFDISILDGSLLKNRQYAHLLLKKCKSMSAAKMVIGLAAKDNFYHDKITGFVKLYYHIVEIVQKAKAKTKKSNVLKIR